MRKLKLQMQLSVDGYVCGPNGEMDWMVWDWDEAVKDYVKEITRPVDCILLGRKLAQGFIPHWTAAAKEPAADEFTRKMVDTPKVVFSKTLTEQNWENTRIESGDLMEAVTALKNEEGGDIIVYGGAGFVSNLIAAGLIDELHLWYNPTAIGAGMPIFSGRTNLKLVKATAFNCGEVVIHYEPIKA